MPHDINHSSSITSLLKEVGEYQLMYWPGTVNSREFVSTKKDNGSYVTSVDIYSDEQIVSALKKLYPQALIMSEETPIPADIALSKEVWILDPLDGTQSFMAGTDDFAILLAQSEAHKLTAGYIYAPARNQFAQAHLDKGAFLGTQVLTVSRRKKLEKPVQKWNLKY